MFEFITTLATAAHDLLVYGDYTGGWYTTLGINEDHRLIDVLLTLTGR